MNKALLNKVKQLERKLVREDIHIYFSVVDECGNIGEPELYLSLVNGVATPLKD